MRVICPQTSMSNTRSTDTDPWDRPLVDEGKAVSARHKGAALSNAIPDDWDDAPSSGEEDSQRIWDNANKEAPMPQLVATSPRTGSISSIVPPASAFQSPIRILKRSTQKGASASDSSTGEPGASAAIAGTFAERSARYNAARERIFARTTEEDGSGGGGGGAVSAAVIRNPKGPEPAGPNGQGGEGSQGFRTRTGKRGDSGQASEKKHGPQLRAE